MRIVITGASGNVGTALLRRLEGRGHELVGVVRRVPAQAAPYAQARWYSVDLSEPRAAERLTPVLRGADAVVHLAWGFQPTRDPDYLERLGVGGTRAVLESAREVGVAHVVHMSSVGAYSPSRGPEPVDESYPTDGTPTSVYSRHKVAAERLLDDFEQIAPHPTVARMRPGFVLQRDAASGLLRYGVPPYVPARALGWLPVLPLARSLVIPVVHADDLADAVARVLERGAGGAFNVSGDPPVRAHDIARAFGARLLPVPAPLVGRFVDLTWRARLQAIDRGWVDLAFSVPLLDTTRARTVLGWAPQHDAVATLADTVQGMQERASTRSPVLRARSLRDEIAAVARTRRMIGSRHRP